MGYKTTKDFWDRQASEFSTSPQATTNDYYMREIEIKSLNNKISQMAQSISKIADIGCGNGFSTLALAQAFPDIEFYGYDYSERMIENAVSLSRETDLTNLEFHVLDLTQDGLHQRFDLIYTDRCLINLPSWKEQKKGIDKICRMLSTNGTYLMIENFIDGQNNFNLIRRQVDLLFLP